MQIGGLLVGGDQGGDRRRHCIPQENWYIVGALVQPVTSPADLQQARLQLPALNMGACADLVATVSFSITMGHGLYHLDSPSLTCLGLSVSLLPLCGDRQRPLADVPSAQGRHGCADKISGDYVHGEGI